MMATRIKPAAMSARLAAILRCLKTHLTLLKAPAHKAGVFLLQHFS